MAKKSQSHATSLVIVESPTKAKTINRYLGPQYKVMASRGHVRDLPPNDIGIDFEQRFEPVYQTLQEKRRVVSDLKKAADKAESVFLATDLDREGEAIAWHLVHALGLDEQRVNRVVFNEITKQAIQEAFATPHHLNMDKVNAQQARRLLDRIVGYMLSPLLQSKIGRGLSAGRVQSVAVRLIVERELEIRAFTPEESWRIAACFSVDPSQADSLVDGWTKLNNQAGKSGTGPTAKTRNAWLSKHACLYAELVTVGGNEFKPTNVTDARAVAEALGYVVGEVQELPWEEYAGKGLTTVTLKGDTDRDKAPHYAIKDIQTRRTTSRPSPPFTTATLQQAASNVLGFGTGRTMRVAQQLYEGLDLGGKAGQTGLITYMRTDSTNLSGESVKNVRALIQEQYGTQHLPDKPNVFGKAKRAQEAHEAIRPSDATRHPDHLKELLTADQFKLYNLIWRRFVACQMTPAQWDSTSILISADTPQGEAIFKTTGRKLVFDGYLRVWNHTDTSEVILPELEQSAGVGLVQLDTKQQFTSPPPRYSEAALVKKLEAEGIGRPSTYAAIIQTVLDRGYVELIDKRLHPTYRGEVVTDKLIGHFPKIMDVKFTSFMEDELDKVEELNHDWVHVLEEFYEPFKKALDKAQVEMERPKAEPSEYACPECGKMLVYRHGKNGRFLSCETYPDCKVSMNVDAEGKPVKEIIAEEPCSKCGKPMMLRKSRMGPFLGCTGYPECTHTLPSDEHGVPLKKVEPDQIQETCDECSMAMAVKFSRGKAFLGCTGYPKCKATKPLPPGVYVEKPKPEDAGARCDKCGRGMVIRKSRRGPFLSCSGFPRCRNAMPLDKLDHLRALEAEGKIPDSPPETESAAASKRKKDVPKTKDGKVDIAALGPPPEGFAWTRTGRPVVETWPEDDTLTCPDCGGEATIKTGRFGPYFGCTNYPKCSFVANLRGAAKKHAEAEIPGASKPKPIPTEVPCPECGASMVIRSGRTGAFLGCSKYPKCRASQPLPEGETVESLTASKA